MVTQFPPNLEIPPSAMRQRSHFSAAYSVLEQAILDGAFPGAAFSVLAEDRVVALDAVGRFTYEAGASPVTPSTLFDLASVTKVMATTSMAMLLHQRGLLGLDLPLVAVLPGFAAGAPAGDLRHRVTLRMLLAHASGLPGYVRLFETHRDSEALLSACLHLPLEAFPGSRSEYSDPGFILLGKALEAIAGEKLSSFVARELFKPLGLGSACFCPPASWQRFASPTEIDQEFRGRIVQGEVQDENCFVLGGTAGHAGLFSNALDPVLYARAILNADSLFTTETIRLFTDRAGLPKESSRALGWDTPSQPSSSGKLFSFRSAGHLGYAGTSLWLDLERRIAVVLLTNRTWPDRKSQKIRAVRPLFHDAVMEKLLYHGGIY
jgi:serine-type D-Ala-D-Ala carboxypeptidase